MKRKIITIILIVLIFVSNIFTFTFSIINSRKLIELRNLWIETAMNTFHHKWLATSIFPQDIIDEVMNKKVEMVDSSATNTNKVEDTIKKEMKSEIFSLYENKSRDELDFAGNPVYIVDNKQQIAISNIYGESYVGKIAIIEEPSRVFIGHTSKKDVVGNNILTYLGRYNAILGVNASGFADYDGVGDGGEIMGLSYSEGESWGTYIDTYNTIALDKDNKLIIGNISDWSNIRDGCQFNPALILNGEKQVEGSAGWGISPRTAIGQREDGAILILTIDGRKPGYSLGATMEDCANELLKYDVVNAAACDGGSSTIMGYNGEIITRCSSPQDGGRYLPNAILVKKIA